jgi:phosphatidylserine decarboxylase
MSSQAVAAHARRRIPTQFQHLRRVSGPSSQPCRGRPGSRQFSSARTYRQKDDYKEPFGKRLRKALGETKIKWYPIPVGLGIAFLGLVQFNRVNEREKKRSGETWETSTGGNLREDTDEHGRPQRRERIRPTGPWYD